MFRNASRKIVIVGAAVGILVCTLSMRAATFEGSLQGTVRTSSGELTSGAFVKIINAEKHLTFMVISQAQGRYSADNLPPGKYTVQGIGNGLVSPHFEVEVAAGKPTAKEVVLTMDQAPLLAPDLASARGESGEEFKIARGPKALPEGDGQKIVGTKCIQCHSIQNVLRTRGSRAKWEGIVRTMREFAQTGSATVDLTDQEGKIAVDYLTAKFPDDPPQKPADPNSRLPHTLQQGAGAKYMIVQYDVPSPVRGFHEITLDPRGNAWVNELSGGTGHIAKLDAQTLAFTEVATPTTGATRRVILNGMSKGQGDQLWVVDALNRRLMRYDSKTGEFNSYTVPKLKWGTPMSNSIRVNKDGSVWFTAIQSNAVVSFNPATEKWGVFDVPSGVKSGKRAAPYGMTIDGDGKVWFAEFEFDKMGRVDPATGKVDEFPVPLEWNGPIRPRKVDHDGNGDVWVGLHGAGKIMKIDHKTLKMTIYTPPTAKAGVYGICGDMKNNVIWFAEDAADIIARFDPKTEKFTEYPLPTAETDIRRCEVDPANPNRIWYSGVVSNRIGYLEVTN